MQVLICCGAGFLSGRFAQPVLLIMITLDLWALVVAAGFPGLRMKMKAGWLSLPDYEPLLSSHSHKDQKTPSRDH